MTGLPISGGSLRCDHAKAPTGLYLQDLETGNVYGLGEGSRWRVLSPAEQEGICRGLGLIELLDLLGLDPRDD